MKRRSLCVRVPTGTTRAKVTISWRQPARCVASGHQSGVNWCATETSSAREKVNVLVRNSIFANRDCCRMEKIAFEKVTGVTTSCPRTPTFNVHTVSTAPNTSTLLKNTYNVYMRKEEITNVPCVIMQLETNLH